MPRHKKVEKKDVDELLHELTSAEGAINDIVLEESDTYDKKDKPLDDADKKRSELLKLAEDGELDKSVAYIKKASQKVIDKLYIEYERKRMQKANEFLTDLLISKFASTLGGLNAIEDEKELSNDLKKDELLKRDVYSVVEKVTPWLPFLGFLSGGITTAKHVYSHKTKPLETINEVEEPNVE